MFWMKTNKETLNMWVQKCHKLEKENKKLHKELEAISEYKAEYERLIEDAKKIKAHYQQLEKGMDSLYEGYKAELNRVLEAARE